jgi:hypothetical protein
VHELRINQRMQLAILMAHPWVRSFKVRDLEGLDSPSL